MEPLRDGHGMRRGLYIRLLQLPPKGGRKSAHHNLSRDEYVDGIRKRKGIRLRIVTSEISKKVSSERNDYKTTDDGLANLSRCATKFMTTQELADALASGEVIRSMAVDSIPRIKALMKQHK